MLYLVYFAANLRRILYSKQQYMSNISIKMSIQSKHVHFLMEYGFILPGKGWILSPAFDINPNEDGSGLSLNISLDDNSLDLNLTLEITDYFRLTNENALKIIEDIKKSVTNWRSVANKYQLPGSEQELMAKVFERFL